MESIKTLLTSKRGMAMVISVAAGLASRYGYELDAQGQEQLGSLVLELISAASGIYAATRHIIQKKKAK